MAGNVPLAVNFQQLNRNGCCTTINPLSGFARRNRLQAEIVSRKPPRKAVLLRSFPFPNAASSRCVPQDASFPPGKGHPLLGRDTVGRLVPSLLGNCFISAELRLSALAFHKCCVEVSHCTFIFGLIVFLCVFSESS